MGAYQENTRAYGNPPVTGDKSRSAGMLEKTYSGNLGMSHFSQKNPY